MGRHLVQSEPRSGQLETQLTAAWVKLSLVAES
jgi:hypothetical protein